MLCVIQIPESFADCLGGLLSVMGQNVTVKLEALGDTTFKKVHTSKDVNWTTPNKMYENRNIQGKKPMF